MLADLRCGEQGVAKAVVGLLSVPNERPIRAIFSFVLAVPAVPGGGGPLFHLLGSKDLAE